MKQKIMGFLGYVLLFFGSIAILTAAMVGTARIPFEKIVKNIASSAELLCERRVFFSFMENVYPSKIDRYADSITVSIANQLDSDTPLRAVMTASYYYTPDKNENDNLMDSLIEGYYPNQQYLRYWHGSAGVIRFLLMFTDLRGIYILHAVLMGVLLLLLTVQLFRHRFFAAGCGMLVSMIAVSVWFVPFSLEYTWTFLVMLVTCICAVHLTVHEKNRLLGPLFLLSGIVTNFLDFLTTETLALLMPLLMILAIRRTQNKLEPNRAAYLECLKLCVIWGIGYAGMWVMKWVLASAVLHENVMPYIQEHIAERLNDTGEMSLIPYLLQALWRNLKCLFPFAYEFPGVLAFIIIALVLPFVIMENARKSIDKKMLRMYALIALVPYIRYLILHNHSYIHFFFTYRAQAATILALFLMAAEIIEWKREEKHHDYDDDDDSGYAEEA